MGVSNRMVGLECEMRELYVPVAWSMSTHTGITKSESMEYMTLADALGLDGFNITGGIKTPMCLINTAPYPLGERTGIPAT